LKYLPFILRHLRRNWIRTTSTILGMALCIFLFCTLRTVIAAIDDTRASGNTTRLVTRHALSLAQNLPLPYEGRIATIPGVKSVAISTWFGGSLPAKKETKDQDEGASEGAGPDFSKFFTNLGVEDEPFFGMHPELKVPAEQMKDYMADQRGCLIGKGLVKQFGWKVGDTFYLESFIPPYRKKDGPFEFVVRGIYDADLAVDASADDKVMYFHYKYLYEGTGRQVGAGIYVVQLQNPSQAGTVTQAIDHMFENSDTGTKTETEAAFRADFLAMVGNLALLLNSIGLAVIFTILLVTANTMSMAVRERRTEIAVLKTLGFSSGRVLGLILAESLTIGTLGGVLGLALSAITIWTLPQLPNVGAFVRGFPNFGLHWLVTTQGLLIALFLGAAAGLVPGMVAYRSRISTMLREV
jgi:putative ABC transport system permease protein